MKTRTGFVSNSSSSSYVIGDNYSMGDWEETMERIMDLRKKLFDAIKKILEKDGHHKGYEGAIKIGFPNYFEDKNQEPRWTVDLACYLIGPGRHNVWDGKTLDEALDKAERDIENWIKDEE